MYIPYGIIEWYKSKVCNLYPNQIGNLYWHAVLKSLIINNRSPPSCTMCILPLSLRKIRIFPINIKYRTIEKSLSWYRATHVFEKLRLFFLLNHPWILPWTSGMGILISFSSSFFISIFEDVFRLLPMFCNYCFCTVFVVWREPSIINFIGGSSAEMTSNLRWYSSNSHVEVVHGH